MTILRDKKPKEGTCDNCAWASFTMPVKLDGEGCCHNSKTGYKKVFPYSKACSEIMTLEDQTFLKQERKTCPNLNIGGFAFACHYMPPYLPQWQCVACLNWIGSSTTSVSLGNDRWMHWECAAQLGGAIQKFNHELDLQKLLDKYR